METIKLLAVTGYYQNGDYYNFVEEKSWRGTALLREDLTFEGIVVDNSATTNFDRLISGTLVEYTGTYLIKFSNHGFCPCSFFGMSTGKEIIGGWTVHGRRSFIDRRIPISADGMRIYFSPHEDQGTLRMGSANSGSGKACVGMDERCSYAHGSDTGV